MANHTQLGNIAVGAPGSEVRQQENLDTWLRVYRVKLEEAILKHPELYAYPVQDAPIVAARMREAFRKGSFNIDSHAIRATCKHFRIAHTYKAIQEALSS